MVVFPPVSTAAFAVLKILEPADYLLTPLHSASRLAWREVTSAGSGSAITRR